MSIITSFVNLVRPFVRAGPAHLIFLTSAAAASSPPVTLQRNGDPGISLSS